MIQYLAIKKVTLRANGKEFRKDAVITADDVGQDNIKRYIARGYVKPIGTRDQDVVLTGEVFLTPDEVATLERKQLVEYAKNIGFTDFKSSIKTPALVKLVNEFIEGLEEGEIDDDDSGDDGEDL